MLIFLRGEHAGALVEPYEAFLRAAVGAELDRLYLHRPEPGVLGLQEERHFGFAEAVDRLHRVADEEQRAAVTLLPAGRQLGEELELRERGVLELVDQDVRDSRRARAGGRSDLDRAEGLSAVRELGEMAWRARRTAPEPRDRGLEQREDRSSASHCRSSPRGRHRAPKAWRNPVMDEFLAEAGVWSTRPMSGIRAERFLKPWDRAPGAFRNRSFETK
jgi:hypothetical protein